MTHLFLVALAIVLVLTFIPSLNATVIRNNAQAAIDELNRQGGYVVLTATEYDVLISKLDTIAAKVTPLPLDPSSESSVQVLPEVVRDHLRTQQYVYPNLSSSITAISGSTPWSLGAYSPDIITMGQIPYQFAIIGVDTSGSDSSSKLGYQLNLYYGASDILCGSIAWSDGGQTSIGMQTCVIPSGSRIRARVASSQGNHTANIKLIVQTY